MTRPPSASIRLAPSRRTLRRSGRRGRACLARAGPRMWPPPGGRGRPNFGTRAGWQGRQGSQPPTHGCRPSASSAGARDIRMCTPRPHASSSSPPLPRPRTHHLPPLPPRRRWRPLTAPPRSSGSPPRSSRSRAPSRSAPPSRPASVSRRTRPRLVTRAAGESFPLHISAPSETRRWWSGGRAGTDVRTQRNDGLTTRAPASRSNLTTCSTGYTCQTLNDSECTLPRPLAYACSAAATAYARVSEI